MAVYFFIHFLYLFLLSQPILSQPHAEEPYPPSTNPQKTLFPRQPADPSSPCEYVFNQGIFPTTYTIAIDLHRGWERYCNLAIISTINQACLYEELTLVPPWKGPKIVENGICQLDMVMTGFVEVEGRDIPNSVLDKPTDLNCVLMALNCYSGITRFGPKYCVGSSVSVSGWLSKAWMIGDPHCDG